MQASVLYCSGFQSKSFCVILHLFLLIKPALFCPGFQITQNNKNLREKNYELIKHKKPSTPLPENFDAREAWPLCETIKYIPNQKKCGNCWAHATAGMISDRTCIASNQTLTKRQFSTEDLYTCCKTCLKQGSTNPCHGGISDAGISYWMHEGLVSGGGPDSNEGCKPLAKSSLETAIAEPCVKECTNKNYKKSYERDKLFGKKLLIMTMRDPFHYWDSISLQIEIMKNGPVVGWLYITKEFSQQYGQGFSGVFENNETSSSTEPHGVRILGWGVENDKPYWLIANSWGPEWSQKGTFKLLRGNNTLGIEDYAVAGVVGDIPPSSGARKFNTFSVRALLINLFILFVLRLFS